MYYFTILAVIKAIFPGMKRAILVFIVAWSLLLPMVGQEGGKTTYGFLELTNSARVAALGGDIVSIRDDDLNLTFHNPALLTPAMDQHMNLNYVNYFSGINYGYASYALHREGIGDFAAGIHYADYGGFDRADPFGVPDGSFRASEYAINLIYARPVLDSLFTVGVNVKPIFSVFEQYTSLGLTMDLGLSYFNASSLTQAGLVIKNFGTQITTYDGRREPVPFEIQAGITQGLAHAPFRFTLTFQHLEKWDLTYDTGTDDNLTFGSNQEDVNRFDAFGDKLMRHVLVGVEFLVGENFHFDLGYNYKRRQEMKMDNRPGMVGFSWGFGFRVSKFHVAYGRSSYHLAGGTNHFSITTNLDQFYRQSR